jgi:predicted aspartyl protease
MGTIRTTGQLTGPAGTAQIEFVVDTGATLTKIGEEVARRLGLVAIRTDEVEFANGAVGHWPVAEARLSLAARPGPPITIQCWIAPGNGEALLGVVALEAFLLEVDPIRRELRPARGLAL